MSTCLVAPKTGQIWKDHENRHVALVAVRLDHVIVRCASRKRAWRISRVHFERSYKFARGAGSSGAAAAAGGI
jgi:hypothetical protein